MALEAADLAVRIRGLTRSFGAAQILRGVDLDIARGGVTVVIGMSGAGKSVLLKLIMGLLRADGGSIEIDGTDITKLRDRQLREIRRRFGYVFQDGALFDSMNVFDNVAFPMREHKDGTEAQIQARVRECLERVGLDQHGHKMPGNLSGGMRKRASLARALVRKPDFLLYDEPTTGLDPIRTAAIDHLISETQRLDPTLTSIVISHDMQATFSIAHHIAMLLDGRILVQGTPDEIRGCPDARVQQFITGQMEGPIEV